jgi:hypothetical protein
MQSPGENQGKTLGTQSSKKLDAHPIPTLQG